MAFNKDTDYQALIDAAVLGGNFKAAAGYEQQRNEKINYLNEIGENSGNATTTDYYSDYLKPNGPGFEYKAPAPTFDYSAPAPSAPQTDSRIDEMLDQILNRDKFSYNVETDPLFQTYKDIYTREGRRSMNDTLASAATFAGGMNSNAITAANQANNYYAAQLGDKIPELHQLAYQMYLNDIDAQVRDLGLLQQMDATQYDRYRDTLSDWRNDRDFAYNQYLNDLGIWTNDRDFAYGQYRDETSDKRYESETAYNRAMQLLANGLMPETSILEAAGISQEEADAWMKLYLDNHTPRYYGGEITTTPTITITDALASATGSSPMFKNPTFETPTGTLAGAINGNGYQTANTTAQALDAAGANRAEIRDVLTAFKSNGTISQSEYNSLLNTFTR